MITLRPDSCGDPFIHRSPRGEGLPVPRGLGIFPAGRSQRGDSDICIGNLWVKIKFLLGIGQFHSRHQVKSNYNQRKSSIITRN